ncbi:hypothetical protein [Flavobacterium panici]|uniref:Uncharacterized protein n=1 Tax=Flavobacterium panici TaxID=2654843 RepID=A0A9N8J198_9FLAO|nr:hypothetical protein [Flavobacterium panici]CAC9974390.1 hypothetical protein FLAPXU55_02087 [Flavobacterium panici]
MKPENYEDPDIRAAFEWLISYMSAEHWATRRDRIEKSIANALNSSPFESAELSEMHRLSIDNDVIGWYLYLMDMLLNDIAKYEPVQGSRAASVFFAVGKELEIVKGIRGIENKVKRLLKNEKAQADSIFFEILTAVTWVKNGWKVNFIAEVPNEKSPDLLAERQGEEWFIECKRLSGSEYGKNERIKWLKMLSYINVALLTFDMVLDIVFHVELNSLDDRFLEKELKAKLPFIKEEGIIFSNEIWDVSVSFVDFDVIDEHLEKFFVKEFSPQVQYLIAGKKEFSSGFACGILGQYVHYGQGAAIGRYITRIDKAYGAYWQCDAPKAIDSKAKDIKRQLKSAVEQFPDGRNAAIHVGIETVDGPQVEKLRFDKIFKTIGDFNPGNKHLRRIYCNFFQSYAPPEICWVIDETSNWHSVDLDGKNFPLKRKFIILPEEASDEESLHWLRPQP